jgi:hypothetical protein
MVDWDQVRAMKFSTETPPADWDRDVTPISMKGLALLGLHRRTHRLHFDGIELVTKYSLERFERTALAIGTASAAVIALIEIGRAVVWITS